MVKRILGIETSCDETAVALLEYDKNKVVVKQNLVSSQIPIHQKYGGVVPEIAARNHVPEMVHLLSRALGKNGMDAFDAIAVTEGPGLSIALRVGVEAARTLAYLSGKPVVGVNHLEGHIASAWLHPKARANWKFPLLVLIVSGGHTELVLMKDFGKYKIVGETRDDAAGEAFDKSAKLMGLPYPGGPQISRLAESGDQSAFDLPRPMMNDKSLDFSFSGLKTAVRREWETSVKKMNGEELETAKKNLAASLEETIVETLVEKTMRAVRKHNVKGVVLVGGVSANAYLRKRLADAVKTHDKRLSFFPSDKKFMTDNAAMIAVAGMWKLSYGKKTDWKKLDANPEANL
jgi:N6-L-threonylcarbamoyladenine synthase